MTAQPLAPRIASALRAAPLSIPEGLTLEGPVPAGYRRFAQAATLVSRDLDEAAAKLLSWRVHESAGLAVHASDRMVRTGTVVQLRLGLAAASLRIPCRVIEVIDEPVRRGFTYATLPGHPESGMERFLLERGGDGTIRFTVVAVSAPASLPARLARPLARAAQDVMTRRYLRGLGV